MKKWCRVLSFVVALVVSSVVITFLSLMTFLGLFLVFLILGIDHISISLRWLQGINLALLLLNILDGIFFQDRWTRKWLGNFRKKLIGR